MDRHMYLALVVIQSIASIYLTQCIRTQYVTDDIGTRIIELGGFSDPKKNGFYTEQIGTNWTISGEPTFWNAYGHFIYWCKKTKKFNIASPKAFEKIAAGPCLTAAYSPKSKEDLPAIDAHIFTDKWSEKVNKTTWEKEIHAGVLRVTKPCSKYKQCPTGCVLNHKKNLCTAPWQPFGIGGPQFNDANQGSLGDCYFIAALASIAWHQPEVITNMFVNQSLWESERPVYTTKWLLTGRPIYVAVDDIFPVSAWEKPSFAKYDEHHRVWPMIVEKSWAKIFKSYKGIESGKGFEAFKAITQAPIELLLHEKGDSYSSDAIWEEMEQASLNHFPMYASGQENSVGTIKNHGYAVLEVTSGDTRMVRLYNPHSRSKYKGTVKNEKLHEGHFNMLFEEYLEAFKRTSIAKVRKGYVTSHTELCKECPPLIAVELEFTMVGNEAFEIQLEWPSKRLVENEGCTVLDPRVVLEVFHDGTLKSRATRTAVQSSHDVSWVRAHLPGGDGNYKMKVYAEFPRGPWLREIVVNTYAKEVVRMEQIGELEKPGMRFVTFANFIHNAHMNGRYVERRSERINGLETYWNSANSFLYWCKKFNDWRIGSAEDIEKIRKGACYALVTLGENKDVHTFDVEKRMNEWNGTGYEKNGNIIARESFGDSVLQRNENHQIALEPLENCQHLLRRFDELNNQLEIIESISGDPLFPPQMSSIARPGVTCGDKTQDIEVSCEKFNNWRSLTEIMADEPPQTKPF